MANIYRIDEILYQLIFGIFRDHFGGPLYMANICRINEILYQLIFGIFRDHFFGIFIDHFFGNFYRSFWRSLIYDQPMSHLWNSILINFGNF
jgi:hypothetical protein